MKITHHGGGCCAIKQISMLGCDPDEFMYQFDALEGKGLENLKQYANADARGAAVDSSRNIYWFSRPSETAGERFDAYLDFLRKHRPCSLVEVTIVPYEGSARFLDDEDEWEEYQQEWVPFLEERGFKCVAKVANSNSGNHVHVYHLVLEDPDWDWDNYDINSYFDLEDEEWDEEICPEYGGD